MLQSMWKYVQAFYKQFILFVILLLLLFTLIGFMTTANPSSRMQSKIFTSWMEGMDGSFFTLLYSMENHAFELVYPLSSSKETLFESLLNNVTSIRFENVTSLIGQEIPGFSTYEHKVIIAGEKMNELDQLSHESGPPLETI